jgi:hypothetical protein
MSAAFDQQNPEVEMEAREAVEFAIASIRVPAIRRVAQRRFERNPQRCVDEVIARMYLSDDEEIKSMVSETGEVRIDPKKVSKWVEFFVKYILPALISLL